MIGFTEGKILNSYNARLEEVVRDRKLKNPKILFEDVLRPHYNSYRFTESGVRVFNPRSITKFLIENPEDLQPYWAREVKHRTLVKHTVQKFLNAALNILRTRISNVQAERETLDRTKCSRPDSRP